MRRKRVQGLALLAVPIVGSFAFTVNQVGLGAALVILAGVAGIVACLYRGAQLLVEDASEHELARRAAKPQQQDSSHNLLESREGVLSWDWDAGNAGKK